MGTLLQDLMKGAPDTPNVVEACNLEGRQERLDGLLSQLEMCEKALQVYATSCIVQCFFINGRPQSAHKLKAGQTRCNQLASWLTIMSV